MPLGHTLIVVGDARIIDIIQALFHDGIFMAYSLGMMGGVLCSGIIGALSVGMSVSQIKDKKHQSFKSSPLFHKKGALVCCGSIK